MAADPLMDDDLVDYEDDAVLNDVTEDAASKTEYAPLLPPSSSSFLPSSLSSTSTLSTSTLSTSTGQKNYLF